MINIQALEQALSGIEELGHAELEFQAGSTAITLRMLTPEEEMDVQRYARQATSDVPDNAPADEKELGMMLFLDRFKQQVLAYSIIQIDALDLRDVSSIATGEKTDSGKDIHIPKHEAVRNLVEKWKRPVLMSAFAKYGELTERVENDAESNIKYTPTERTAEIERLENRLAELKRAQAEEAPPSANNRVARQVEAMVDLDKHQRETGTSMAGRSPSHLRRTTSDSPPPDGAPDDEPPVVVTSAPSRHDRQASVSGVSEPTVPVPPPGRPELHQSPPSEADASHPEQHTTTRRSSIPTAATRTPPPDPKRADPEPEPEPSTEFDSMMDSMSDPFDEDSIAAENARLIAARKQAAAEQAAAERAAAIRAEALGNSRDARNASEGGPVTPAKRRRTPPHRHAANTADAALDANVGDIKPARSSRKGTIGDKEVYGMPAVTLSKRGGPKAAGGTPPVDQTSRDGGSANPRFAGRRRKK